MTIDEKVRFGMLALTGAGIIFASLGLHIVPLDACGGNAQG